MTSKIGKLGVASLTALLAVAAFIVFSPKNESSAHNASTPPELTGKAQQTEVEVPVNFTLPLYTKRAALVCPSSVAFDNREGYGLKGAMDAHLSTFGHEDAIEKSGCQEWREGLSVALTDEGQKQAAEWESEKSCGMVSFSDGYIFSCDLKNSPSAAHDNEVPESANSGTQGRPQAQTTGAAPSNPQAKALIDCMISKAQDGQYSSDDGGKSATQLLGVCPDQLKEYVDVCVQAGDTDGNCTLKSGILAQSTLKLLNK